MTAFAASRGIVDWRAENGEQAVAQKLVHDPVVPIDDVDQDLENGVEAGDDLGRRARARGGCERADVDEHDADPPHFAELGRADRDEPLDHLRRDVLTEEVGHFVAGRRGGERPLEMALDRRSDIAGQQAGCEKDGAARQMIADAEVRVLASPLEMQDDHGEDEELDRGDRSGEGRKLEVEPQGRENDEEKIEQRGPRPENGRREEISGEEIEQHRRKACFDERVHVATDHRKISTATNEDREQAGREQFVGDEGRERRRRCTDREPIVIDRPDEAGGECRGQEDQNEDESLERGQDEHAPPLA